MPIQNASEVATCFGVLRSAQDSLGPGDADLDGDRLVAASEDNSFHRGNVRVITPPA